MIWNSELGIRSSESRASGGMSVRVFHSAFRNPNSAFTLVELLIVISIIAILSAMLLGVAATSAEQARGSRSKSMIAKINGLVMQQYDTYKDRRAPVNPAVLQAINVSNPPQQRGTKRAQARLNALRELIRMEMPDRWSDVLLAPVPGSNPASVTVGTPIFLEASTGSTFRGPTPLIETYRRQYFAIAQNASQEQILANESAECLYLFVMHATSDGEARGLFNESSIGDTDGDGAYEFLDGWGNPIDFIRWPAGFDSSKQNSVAGIQSIGSRLGPEKAIEAVAVDHDPFDLFRVDQYVDASQPARGFRLMPLIYSRGSDEAAGLEVGPNFIPFGPSSDPYAQVSSGRWLGQSISDESVDNITNHNLTGE